MAEFPMPVPSWIQRDYNPAEIFLSSVKTGAAIGQSQLQLQEEQRQSDLKAQLTREEMQTNLLRAQQQLAVDQAYKKQQTDMAQKQLDELKAYHADLRDKAAQDLIIRGINARANVQRAQATADRQGKGISQFVEQQDLRAAMKKYEAAQKALETAPPNTKEDDMAMLNRNAVNAEANLNFLRRKLTPDSPEWQPEDTSGAASTKSGLRYKIESVK